MSSLSASSEETADVPAGVKRWRGAWMAVAAVAIVVAMYYLLRDPRRPVSAATGGAPGKATAAVEPVRVAGPGLIAVAADTPLRQQLEVVALAEEQVAFPKLSVAGSILARVREGTDSIEDRWQFSDTDLSTDYADWLRTKGEISFADSQLQKTHELVEAQTAFLEATVTRLGPLVKSASIPEKDFKQAKAELLKAQLQGEKDIYTAQSALRVAQKNRAALERSLSHSGIEPKIFSRAVEHMVLIAANVPETKVSQVAEGQACQVRFYGYPDRLFQGHVESLGSSLTSDRRTLRVLFELNDPEDLLKPGMYGEVGLGTDDRGALLVPDTALLHIDRHDYVLVEATPEMYRAKIVEVGELRQGKYEVLSGLAAGERVLAKGAILLKPAVAQSLVGGVAGP